jgi:hypothetical protein
MARFNPITISLLPSVVQKEGEEAGATCLVLSEDGTLVLARLADSTHVCILVVVGVKQAYFCLRPFCNVHLFLLA